MNIRRRLVFLYALALAVILLLLTTGLVWVFGIHLSVEIDDALKSWAGPLRDILPKNDQDPGSGLGLHDRVMESTGIEPVEIFAIAWTGDIPVLEIGGDTPNSRDIRKAVSEAGSAEGFLGFADADRRYRLYYETNAGSGAPGDTGVTLVLGRSLEHTFRTLDFIALVSGLLWIAAVLLCTGAAWFFVGQTLNPVKHLTRDALGIAVSGELRQRLALGNVRDEFGALALAFNQMLASLEKSVEIRKQFLADTSHELRTPLTSIRANLEFVLRAKDVSTSVRQAAIYDVVSEVDRMNSLVNQLLVLARFEGESPGDFSRFDVLVLVRDIVDGLRRCYSGRVVLREDMGRSMVCFVRGNTEQVRRALVIVLDNALKYSPPSSTVIACVVRAGTEARFTVCDEGPGVPESEIPFLGGRFFRASNVRDLIPGTGLGLAIVTSVIDSHCGTITFNNRAPTGLEVRITFPIVD